MTEFTTPEHVGAHLGGSDQPVAASEVAEATAAANAFASTLDGLTDDDGKPTPAAHLGVTMLAARLYRRRLSPAGIEALTDTGAAYVARTDSDIARLLRLDAYRRPKVG